MARRPSRSDALLQALLASDPLARPQPYRSPFAGAKPAIAKAAAVPTVNAMPQEPVDTSGFAGIGAGLGQQAHGNVPTPSQLGSTIWNAIRLFGTVAAKSHGVPVPPAFSYTKPKGKK